MSLALAEMDTPLHAAAAAGEDRRVAWLRSQADSLYSQGYYDDSAQLYEQVEAALAARAAAGVSQWGSELPPLFLQLLFDYLKWKPAVCGKVWVVCSASGDVHDANCPRLTLRRWDRMEGKWGWFARVTTLRTPFPSVDENRGVGSLGR